MRAGDHLRLSRLEAIRTRLPLGVQYYRPPAPPSDEWARDLAHARRLGFDHVYAWVMWPWVERRPGEWTFDDYDALFDLAAQADLGVILNLELWAVPNWAERDEFRTLDLDRRPRPFRSSIIHSLFAARPCWDNLELRTLGERFLREAAVRFRTRPNLLLWKVWNEPDQLACACPSTLAKYRRWLAERFGSLEAASGFLGRWYGDWDEIRPPTHTADTPGYLLFRSFLCQSISETTRWAHRIVREADSERPILADTRSRSTPRLSAFEEQVWDDWELAKLPDVFGGHLHSTIFHPAHDSALEFAKPALDLEAKRAASAASGAGQHFWVTELPGGPGRMNGYHRNLLPGEMTFNLWASIAHGAKALGIWQFKPERVGPEAPGWGLVGYDGADTYRSQELAGVAATLRRHESLFVQARAPATPFALYYSPESCVAVGGAAHFSYATAFLGAFAGLWLRNVHFDVIRRPQDIRHYRAVYLPMPWWIDAATADHLLDFVRSGGTALVEAGFASYAENGWYCPETPGQGLSAALGYLEREILAAPEATVEMAAGRLVGAGERRTVEVGAASVVGSFAGGEPAVLRCSVGSGALVYVATFPSLHLAATGDLETARTVSRLVGLDPAVHTSPEGQVTCRLLERGADRVAFVFNHGREPVAARVELPYRFASHEVIHGPSDSCEVREGSIRAQLQGKEVLVLLLGGIQQA